jgi:hypothetical protein
VVNDLRVIEKAASKFDGSPFIIRPNRCSCYKEAYLIQSIAQLKAMMKDQMIRKSPDGMWLVQQFIDSSDQSITRLEFIGGKFYYALKSYQSKAYPFPKKFQDQVPISLTLGHNQSRNPNEIIKDYEDDSIDKYRRFFEDNKIDIGSIDFVTDREGKRYVYNFSTDISYDREAEISSGFGYYGYERIADFLYGVMESRQILSAWARAQQKVISPASDPIKYGSAS